MPANDPTNVDPLMFTAVFDQDVTGFGSDDVEVSGTADLDGVRVKATATATPDTYRIAVSGVAGRGTVALTVRAGAAENATLQANSASNTVSVNFDGVGPVVRIALQPGQLMLAGTGPFRFTIELDEPLGGIEASDFVIGGTTGASTGVLSGLGSNYVLDVDNVFRSGTITVNLREGAITDRLGNPATSAGATATVLSSNLPASGNSPLPLREALMLVLFGCALMLVSRRRLEPHR